MSKVTLEVESVVDISESGLWAATYIGDNCEPSAEVNMDWDTWIERFVESITLTDRLSIPFHKLAELEEKFDTVHVLREVADKLERSLLSLKAFDRKAWLDANNGTYDNLVPSENFMTPMTEMVKLFSKNHIDHHPV